METQVTGTVYWKEIGPHKFWELHTDESELYTLMNPPKEMQVDGVRVNCTIKVGDWDSIRQRGYDAEVISFDIC